MDAPTLQRKPALTGRRLAMLAAAGLLAALAVGLACSLIGQAELSWDIWLRLRLPRLTMGAIVGAALAVSGVALQGLLRNPLAEPYILGISSGAGVGILVGLALVGRLSAPSWVTPPVLALLGAAATCGTVYAIAQRRGRLDPYVLLLSGVIVNVFNGALMLAITLYVDRNQIDQFVLWGMGQLSETWPGEATLAFCIAAVVVGWAVLLLRGSAFNTLGLGDAVAISSGVPVHWLRVETFLVVGLLTSAAVALAGPIGFLGLIVPHICRLVFGADHRTLVIVSGFSGAMFLMAADTICRVAGPWLGTGVVPVGVLTALSGGPFFILLLRRRAGKARA